MTSIGGKLEHEHLDVFCIYHTIRILCSSIAYSIKYCTITLVLPWCVLHISHYQILCSSIAYSIMYCTITLVLPWCVLYISHYQILCSPFAYSIKYCTITLVLHYQSTTNKVYCTTPPFFSRSDTPLLLGKLWLPWIRISKWAKIVYFSYFGSSNFHAKWCGYLLCEICLWDMLRWVHQHTLNLLGNLKSDLVYTVPLREFMCLFGGKLTR